MRKKEYERLVFNNKKSKIEWFLSEPVKIMTVIAFALADCATMYIVFDTYLPQNKYLTIVLTVLFSLALSLIPVFLATVINTDKKQGKTEEGHDGSLTERNKKLVIFLLAAEAVTFTVQMIARIMTTKAVVGDEETADAIGTAIPQGSDAITGADVYGSIFIGFLPLIFGAVVFAMHYIDKEKWVNDARITNKGLDRDIIVNRLHEELMKLGSTEDYISIQMTRLQEVCRAVFSKAIYEHVERVLDSQTEIAMKNAMSPSDANETMVEPYMNVIENARVRA